MLADLSCAMTAVQPLFDRKALYSPRKASGHHSTVYAAVQGYARLRDSTVQGSCIVCKMFADQLRP
jgi:hypothetical protein